MKQGVGATLSEDQLDLLDTITTRFRLSTRGVHRILRLSRTVSDLQGNDQVSDDDLLLAAKLRR